jgi:hypothetical protein
MYLEQFYGVTDRITSAFHALMVQGHDSEPTESGGLVRMWRHDHLTFRPPLQLCEKFAKWVALVRMFQPVTT